MMNQQDDGENGFELVDRPKEGNVNEGPTPLPSWINPPTNLPLNLMSGPPPLVLPVGQLFPTTSTPTVPNSQFFTGSSGVQTQTVSSKFHPIICCLSMIFLIFFFQLQGLSNLPILLPLSPIGDIEPQNPQAATSALEIAVLESPTAPYVKDEPPNEPTKGSGLFGWMKEAMPGKGILAKVAEKARNSVDTMITTLDPQMKEFICEKSFAFIS